MAGTDKAELHRRSLGKIDNPAFHKGPAIIDADDDRLPVAAIGDLHFRTEGQAAVRGGQSSRVHPLT